MISMLDFEENDCFADPRRFNGALTFRTRSGAAGQPDRAPTQGTALQSPAEARHRFPASSIRIGDTAILQGVKTGPDRIRLGTAFYFATTDRLTTADGQDILLRAQSAQVLEIEFADGRMTAGGGKPARPAPKPKDKPPGQGSLF